MPKFSCQPSGATALSRIGSGGLSRVVPSLSNHQTIPIRILDPKFSLWQVLRIFDFSRIKSLVASPLLFAALQYQVCPSFQFSHCGKKSHAQPIRRR